MSWLHDRQPVILSSDSDVMSWLDPSLPWSKGLATLLESHDDMTSPLKCYPVPKEVGKVGAESPTFIQPVSERKDSIKAMFSNQVKSRSLAQAAQGSESKMLDKRKRSPSPLSTQLTQNSEINDSAADFNDIELVKTSNSSQVKHS